jgi:hypothetical protein
VNSRRIAIISILFAALLVVGVSPALGQTITTGDVTGASQTLLVQWLPTRR